MRQDRPTKALSGYVTACTLYAVSADGTIRRPCLTDGFFELNGSRVFIDLTLQDKDLRDTVIIHPEDDLKYVAKIIAEQLT